MVGHEIYFFRIYDNEACFRYLEQTLYDMMNEVAFSPACRATYQEVGQVHKVYRVVCACLVMTKIEGQKEISAGRSVVGKYLVSIRVGQMIGRSR